MAKAKRSGGHDHDNDHAESASDQDVQKKGEAGKAAPSVKCPGCQNVLPEDHICVICGWQAGSWRCDQCQAWWPKAEQFCGRCMSECDKCKRRYPAKEGECPDCSQVKYELEAILDSDDAANKWELFVFCFRQKRGETKKAVAAKVRFVDPLQKAGDPISITTEGGFFLAPHSEAIRRVRFILAGVEGEGSKAGVYENPGVYTKELKLPGVAVKYVSPLSRPKKKGDSR